MMSVFGPTVGPDLGAGPWSGLESPYCCDTLSGVTKVTAYSDPPGSAGGPPAPMQMRAGGPRSQENKPTSP